MNKRIRTLLSIVTSTLILAGFSGCTAKNNGSSETLASAPAVSDKTNNGAKPPTEAPTNNAAAGSNTSNQGKTQVNNVAPTNKPQEAQPVKRDIKITESKTEADNEYIKTSVKYPVISGLEDKAIEAKLNDMFKNAALNFNKSIESDAKVDYEYSKKDKNITFRKYEVQTDFKVRYNKNNVLSITALYYQYTGGAHGGTNQVGYNINLKTGELMLLSDIFDKGFNYKDVIVNEILDSMKKGDKMFFNEGVNVVKAMDDKRSYYIEDGNVVVYYGQYEIAPYAAGIPEFKIPFSKLKLKSDLFK
jgi:hypothetical protein